MATPENQYYKCTLDDIAQRIGQIDPHAYDKTRNHLNGKVTWLSPFITHGIVSTVDVASGVLLSHKPKDCYRLLFELGWREFFHRTWQQYGDDIFKDMRHAQANVADKRIPQAVLDASTDISVIDESLDQLFNTGLMHNHARMWVAAMICNLAATHWAEPARWLHYHLLDGDLASNTLSWQWIAGTFSQKKYVANQANINQYSDTRQLGSWLDVPYEAFDNFPVPEHFKARGDAVYSKSIPGQPVSTLQGEVALRSVWQLDPRWQANIDQHIVFVDRELHDLWPMSEKRWQFISHWAKACNAKICYGTAADLTRCSATTHCIRSEYPACNDWPGTVLSRDWLYPAPEKPFNSFSQFFKQVKGHVGL